MKDFRFPVECEKAVIIHQSIFLFFSYSFSLCDFFIDFCLCYVLNRGYASVCLLTKCYGVVIDSVHTPC